MKNKILNYALGGVLLLILLFITGNTRAAVVDGLVDCNQYYKFGSVDMALNPDKQTYRPGDTMAFFGTVTNQNNYPLVNGEVFVKLYRIDPQDGGNPQNGHFEVAEFTGLRSLNVGSLQKKEIIFTHKLPPALATGNYLVHFFFNTDSKYNLAGLSFHPAMPGSMATFKIESDLNAPAYLDKDNVILNGAKYNFRAPNDQQAKDKDVVIKVPLVNSSDQNATVKLTKELYFWDALNPKNMISSTDEEVIVPAKGQKDVNYTISNPSYSVYLLKITAESKQGNSVINVRPVVRDIDQPRLNFPALASFPLVKGQKAVIFTCFHNAALNIAKGKIVMTLKDVDGKVIANNTFEGDIYGNMMATAKEFIPAQDYSAATLTTELFDTQGKLIDSSVDEYDCTAFNPPICATKPAAVAALVNVDYPSDSQFKLEMGTSTTGPVWVYWLEVAVGLIIVIAGVGFIVWQIKKQKKIKV